MSNQKYKKGLENIPLKEINKSLPAYVVVYNILDNDDVVLEKKIDFASAEDRKWIGRISFWAISNHHSVETMALCDVEFPCVE